MNSLIFRSTAHVVIILMLLFSFYMLLRGHNQPGGGFIGALIAVIGFALLMLAESTDYVRERLHYPPLSIAACGLGLALLSGLVGLFSGQAFLTGIWWKDILPLGTPVVFDVGVYLATLGGVLSILLRMDEVFD